MKQKKGWQATDYLFEDIYSCSINVKFEYNGKRYFISCEEDRAMYDDITHERLWSFNSEEEFYNGTIFGKPIQEVIDNSYIIDLC